MPLTLKKLKWHIALGLSVCVYVFVCVSVLVFEKKTVRFFEFHKQIPYKNS